MLRAVPELRRWLASLALMLPGAIPYLAHAMDWKPYSLPTGYIQADMPIYMAKAREAFDDGRFWPTYANPCGASDAGPRLYFQPWTFGLGLVHRLSGLPPGVLFVAFWFLAAWTATRSAVALYEEYVGLNSRSKRLGLVAFLWGGGLLVLGGAAAALIGRGAISWDDLFAFDPFAGWWFLNLGRNLVYPTEALYHALVLTSLYLAAKGRLGSCLAVAAITASCSPFAGLELLAMLGLWGIVEIPARRDRAAWVFLAAVIGLVAAFLGYYVVFLNAFPEHRRLADHMSLDWRYGAMTPLLAYGPVAGLAAWRVRSLGRLETVFAVPSNRLLVACAVAALLLENHDLIVSPRQPLHFTRGYAWSAFFLLGAPSLVGLFVGLDRLRSPWPRLVRAIVLAAMLCDNAAWFTGFARDYRMPDRNGLRITSEGREVLRRLDRDDLLGHVLISEDERLSYLAIAETRLRSWVGHRLETPGYDDRRREIDRLFARGEFLDVWESRPIVVVRYRRPDESNPPDWIRSRSPGRPIFTNRKFQIFQFRGRLVAVTRSATETKRD